MKRSTNYCIAAIGVVLSLSLGGCGSAPSRQAAVPVPVEPVAPVLLDEQTRSDFSLATSALAAGRLEEAERMLVALTVAHPDLYGPYANLGIVYAREGNVESAEKALQKAITLKPGAVETYNQLGILYRNAGRFEDARKAYERALEIDPKYANAQLNIGILYDLYLLDYKNAAKHYKRYQRLVPEKDEEVSMWIADLKRRQ